MRCRCSARCFRYPRGAGVGVAVSCHLTFLAGEGSGDDDGSAPGNASSSSAAYASSRAAVVRLRERRGSSGASVIANGAMDDAQTSESRDERGLVEPSTSSLTPAAS